MSGCGTALIARAQILCNCNYMSTQKQDEPASPLEQIRGWLAGRLPDEWFMGAPEILVDREEITVIGHLASTGMPAGEEAAPAGGSVPGAGAKRSGAGAKPSGAEAEAAAIGRSRRFREET